MALVFFFFGFIFYTFQEWGVVFFSFFLSFSRTPFIFYHDWKDGLFSNQVPPCPVMEAHFALNIDVQKSYKKSLYLWPNRF